jgi:geranylgeranylglycerol-phosphate geranylgeranyltransferase
MSLARRRSGWAAVVRESRAWFGLVRIDRTLAAMLYVLLGAYLAGGAGVLADSAVVRATIVVGLIVASGFALNDYCDIRVDSIGRPHRPIPSGRVGHAAAGRLAWGLAATALAIAATLGPRMVAVAAGALVLSAAYSLRLKDTLVLGNGAMALLVSAIPVFGALAAGTVTPAVLAAASMTLPYIFAQEVLYNVEDEPADRQVGLRTTATRLGVARALTLFRTFAAIFIALALLPWLLGIARDRYLYAALLCSIVPMLAVIGLLTLRSGENAIRIAVNVTRLIWLSSFIPLVLLR